jgi:hypothetical protein
MKKRAGKQKGKRAFPKAGRIPAGWIGTLNANASVWNSTVKLLRMSEIILASMAASLMMLFILLPVYALTMAMIYLKTDAFFPDQTLLFVMLGTCLLGGAIFFALLCQSQVIRFAFDAKRKVLEFTEHKALFEPSVTLVDFDAIFSITPMLMSSHATDGHFQVAFKTAKGLMEYKRMGSGISIENLNLHADWLAGRLGDRVQPMLRLDT